MGFNVFQVSKAGEVSELLRQRGFGKAESREMAARVVKQLGHQAPLDALLKAALTKPETGLAQVNMADLPNTEVVMEDDEEPTVVEVLQFPKRGHHLPEPVLQGYAEPSSRLRLGPPPEMNEENEPEPLPVYRGPRPLRAQTRRARGHAIVAQPEPELLFEAAPDELEVEAELEVEPTPRRAPRPNLQRERQMEERASEEQDLRVKLLGGAITVLGILGVLWWAGPLVLAGLSALVVVVGSVVNRVLEFLDS
jgi:hypothetical protein